jgi:hypothetical protein
MIKLFNKKIKIGIEIDEIFRSKAEQVEKYYYEEFSENGIPEQPYVFDFFKFYEWKPIVETIKELKDEIPETINPLDYVLDDKGNSNADAFLFKKEETISLTPKEVYNRFMYQDYCLEIHGLANSVYGSLMEDIRNFLLKYSKYVDIEIFSTENYFSIPPTLFFLSKLSSKFKTYKFIDNSNEIWKNNNVDILITTNPEMIEDKKPLFKKIIKVNRPYNEQLKGGDLNILNFGDLINNIEFEKMINYKNNK